jgi:DNA repair protein RadA/Sms
MATKSKKIWLCENCGNEFANWSGRCEACGEWNTLKEVDFKVSNISPGRSAIKSDAEFKKFSEIKVTNKTRISTGISEFDRVLGGGVVAGSVILLGGEPGIGKSTLTLELARKIKNIIYLSGEESLDQIKIRAERLGVESDQARLIASGEIEVLSTEIPKSKPELIIVDSIQTVFIEEQNSTPGSLVQVRECGMFLQRLAKQSGVPVLIVGHVTKEGNIAGPRILEHLVDVVLYMEGERFHDARILRGVKNRFGATNEVGLFSMGEKGLSEIKNPSELFLSKHENKPGSAVTATMEGTRPILVEIQALTIPTNFGYPKRTVSGYSLNRLNMLAAVISKHAGINLSNTDIYINIVGGMKLSEPAVDLAVCAAIISSYKNKPLAKDLCLFGEVGLLGEIRQVARENERVKESKTLGYQTPANIKDLKNLIDKTL